MKLYVKDNNGKIYLRVNAQTRNELMTKIGKRNFYVKGKRYSVNDVIAETESNNVAIGAILGGAIGAFIGPIGALTGGTIGGLFANSSDSRDKQDIIIFNRSKA